MRTAIGHAIRAGELLIEAKELVPHGAWQRWLSEHFRGSERTAQGYMQLARAPKPATVADSGVRAALAALAAPRAPDDAEAPAEEDVEVVDAEPVPEPGPSIVDQLREAHGAEEFERATEELAAEDARQRREVFPRAGVERKTWGRIRRAAHDAEQILAGVAFRGVSNWTAAEALDAVAKHFREAAELAAELAAVLRPR